MTETPAESIKYLSDWWRWWGNPLNNIHPTQQDMLPYAKGQLQQLDYLLFLELRSILSLPDKPDRALDNNPEIRSLSLATDTEMEIIQMKSAVLSLEPSILQANAQHWSEVYGVQAPEDVRATIQLWNQIPYKLKPWQESLILNLSTTAQNIFDLKDRALMVLGAYLMSFYPDFFKRWSMTIPYAITLILKSTDPIPEDCKTTMDNWLKPALDKLHRQVVSRYPQETVELPTDGDEEEDQALAQLHNLEEFDDA